MSRIKQFKSQTRDLIHRGFDRHIKLAVTGLSGAGKTALITGVLEQLLYANESQNLPYFNVRQHQRLIGCRLHTSPNWDTPRFDYEKAIERLTGTPGQWPESTRDVSEIRLELKYHPERGLAGKVLDERRLTVDIIDYPGEWLLDLPLLSLTYEQWSKKQRTLFSTEPRKELAKAWLHQLNDLTAVATDDNAEKQIKVVAKAYRQYLADCKEQGLKLLQPGRLVLPGELAGTPSLDFFPWPLEQPVPDAWQSLLERKFEYYKEQVVKPFYQNYFRHFNRQLILVDVLSALEGGESYFDELKLALNEIMQSFNYGQNSLLRRLFSPQIDKVSFVVTKADSVVPSDHAKLTGLINALTLEGRQQLQFERIPFDLFSVAGVATSQWKQLKNGTNVLEGIDQSGELVRVGAPHVPGRLPTREDWQQGYVYPHFQPNFTLADSPLPHIRLDKLLNSVIGDKLR